MNQVAAALLDRRMTRVFLDDPVAHADVSDVLACGLRAPNAGFSQGWDFVVLSTPAQRARYWQACLGENPGRPDAWLRGVSRAPVLIVCCSDPQAYLDRYAEPDKPWQDRDPGHWPIPYWDTDTAMAAYGMLLRAHELRLRALFFGVPAPAHATVREALSVPAGRRLVGVVALGRPDPAPRPGRVRRPRRPTAEVVHDGTFGVPRPD